MPRIISLIASATEIVCALGFEDQLVGRSHECDFPESVKRLPACTEPKFNINGSSYQIDQRVKAVLQESLSVYRVDADRLKQLHPDVIVTQSHCEVCAVTQRDVEEVVGQWLDSKPRIISLEPNNLEDVWMSITQVAQVLNANQKGQEVVSRLTARMAAIAAKTASLATQPSVACIEWIDPLMASGNWMPELVGMAGGRNLFGEAGKHAPWMSWEQLRAKDPDVILVIPCGFDIPRSRADMPTLMKQADWPEMNAVRNRRVYLADGNQFFNRPGPRLVESLEILAEILHPNLFHFGHQGIGWERMET